MGNQEFYQYLYKDIQTPVKYLFQTCHEMGYNFENLDTTYTYPPDNRRNLFYFVKFPRECYVGEGNIVDVLYYGGNTWVLFDGNGGTGNLWLRGNCHGFHERIFDPSDPRVQDGSYLDTKRHPKLKDKKRVDWCQFAQNRRVTTFEVAGNMLYIATPDGVFCIGDNYGQLCNHTHNPYNNPLWVNWTKMNTSAFDGVGVAQMRMLRGSLWFLLTDGRIFQYGRLHWVMEEKFKEITSTNEIVDWIIQTRSGSGYEVILVNRTGSHYHRGSAPTNCITTRDEHQAFNGSSIYNRDTEKLVLCDGVANDLGYLSYADLWL